MRTCKQLQTTGSLLALLLTAHLSHGQDVNVDTGNQNTGSLSGTSTGTGLHFGAISSGEGIASKRSAGGNQFGLDFYTGYTNRLSIGISGNVGIGTTAPTAVLDVNGGILARAYGAISNQGAHLQWNRTGSDGETWLLNQKGGGSGNAGIRFGSATTGNVVTEWARFLDNGNFGIGTSVPTAKFTVRGSGANALPATSGPNQATSQVARFQGSDNLVLDLGSNGGNGAWLQSTDATSLASKYPLMLNPNGGNVGIGTTAPGAQLDVNGNARLNGSVLIGSNITRFTSALAKYPAYGLWVEKGVVASDFAIAAPTAWADFVFAPGYCLPSLSDTEHYIRQYGHLPDMPSEASVKNNGYTLHEMNTRLLQKVEELTLHAIEQEKQLAETRALLQPYALLAAEVASLKARLEK